MNSFCKGVSKMPRNIQGNSQIPCKRCKNLHFATCTCLVAWILNMLIKSCATYIFLKIKPWQSDVSQFICSIILSPQHAVYFKSHSLMQTFHYRFQKSDECWSFGSWALIICGVLFQKNCPTTDFVLILRRGKFRRINWSKPQWWTCDLSRSCPASSTVSWRQTPAPRTHKGGSG